VTYIAGIFGTPVTGSAVFASSTGQLRVSVSRERFNTAIAPMGSNTAKLEQLRSVSFKLRSDATGARQYGLSAEDPQVAKMHAARLHAKDECGAPRGWISNLATESRVLILRRNV
jgi:hypothetical protein